MNALTTIKYVAYGVAIVGVGAIAYQIVKKGKGLADAVAAVSDSVNPLNKENIAYQAATAIGNAVAGDGSDVPLGTRVFEYLNPALRLAEIRMLNNGTPDKSGRFMGGDSDEFGNPIDRSSTRPVPSGPTYELGSWGPSVFSEMAAP